MRFKKEYVLGSIAVLITAGLVVYGWVRRADVMLLAPQGAVAQAQAGLIITATLLCAVVVVFVYLLLALFAWRYHDEHPEAARSHHPAWDHDPKWAEVIWWLVPAAIILALCVILLRSTYALDPYKTLDGKEELVVQVIALDWKWLFLYPKQGVASVNMLKLPAGVPVHFYITTDAPMNSFWIPRLGGMIMAMPGMTTQLHLIADAPGEYEGFSANISGEGFAGMAFTASAVPQEAFELWVQDIRYSPLSLTRHAYDQLALPSSYHPVTYFGSYDHAIFEEVRMKGMMPPSPMHSHDTGAMDAHTAHGMHDM